MSFNCVIPGCNSTGYTKALFNFPIDDLNLLEKWINQIAILDWDLKDLRLSFICEDHFNVEKVLIGSDLSKQLVTGAVPTIFSCISNVDKNSCRFCLKSGSGDRLPINDSVKRQFEDLMSFEVINSNYKI
jgi:hypothetical protein